MKNMDAIDSSPEFAKNASPLERYQALLAAGTIQADPKQAAVMPWFDKIYHCLCLQEQQAWYWRMWPLRSWRRAAPCRGLYVWGGVGIGKTFMLDLFYEALPFERKLRLHFHQFMAQIHAQLRIVQGQKDPLAAVAKTIAARARVLCFDEFVVTDITDAMLLARLFKHLFAAGVCLLATSNVRPDDLYLGGLQRDLFMPAIHLINTHTQVLHLDSLQDYRQLHLQEAGVYFSPLCEEATQQMEAAYRVLSGQLAITPGHIDVLGRSIATVAVTQEDKVVWFEFRAICGIPRCQQDYLELAKRYETVLISDIPIIHARNRDLICNFIRLIDVFYDQKVRVIISAEMPAEDLYRQGDMLFEYARTQSRLTEMQSRDYYSAET